MKQLPFTGVCHQIPCSKNFRVVRNTLLLLLLSVFQVYANNTYSENTTLSMTNRDVTVKKTLAEIENHNASTSKMQQITVTGNVQDTEGIPVLGASVVEKSTGKGTITDGEGNYSIDVSSADEILILFEIIVSM